MRSSSRCCSAIVHPRYCCFLVTPSWRANRRHASRELLVIVARVVTRSLKLPCRAASSSITARALSLSLNSMTSRRASAGHRRWRGSLWCFGSSMRNKAARSNRGSHLRRYKTLGRLILTRYPSTYRKSLQSRTVSRRATFYLIVEFCSLALRNQRLFSRPGLNEF
jgi:hypothetical protein